MSTNQSSREKICYIHTAFQKILFKSILKEEGIDSSSFLVIGDQKHVLDFPRHKSLNENFPPVGFKRARAIIKEIDKEVLRPFEKKGYELWLGCDDNPVSQVLATNKNCKSVVLFEDGLGSYLSYKIKEYIFTRYFATKIKNFIVFYPRFRGFKNVGSNIKPDRYYSLDKNAFPSRNEDPSPSPLVTIMPESFASALQEATENLPLLLVERPVALIVDQPYVEAGYTSAETYSEYIVAIAQYIKKIRQKNQLYLALKYHPGTSQDTARTLRETLKNHGFEITEIEGNVAIENWILKNKKNILAIAGLSSTALFHAKIIHPEISIYFKDPLFAHKKSPVYKKVRGIFEKIGIITINQETLI